MASKDLSTGQLSDYIEDVHRLIKALEKKGDVTSMSRNLSKLTTLVRNRLESPPIACHHREVDYFSNFLAIMQHEFHEDPEQMLATLEHMSWAFEGVVARAELQGDVDLMGCHSHREIRAILELVVNGSMNGRADEKATAYWMRRHSLSHKKAVWLYRLSDQSIKPPPQADSHQEDNHPTLEQPLYWGRIKKGRLVLKQLAYNLRAGKPQRWTDEMRSFVYDLDGEDDASILQKAIRRFPELGDVDMDELDDVRSQNDSLRHEVKLFG